MKSTKTYLELASLYNWTKIDCVKEDKLRSVEDINKEILNEVLKFKD